jgi:transposase-like protein
MEESMDNPKNNPKLPTDSGEKAEPKVIQRWSAARKREIVLRLLRGESLDAVSREIGVEPYRLERWPACCTDGRDAVREPVCFNPPDLAFMPHKYNADRRHHIPRPKRRVTNWAEYNEALRQRGSLTVWFTDEAIAAWKAAPRTTPGGQPHYSDLAITTALTLRAVFHLPLRQTEGLIGSVLQLLGLELPVPDYSTLSRRAQSLELPAQPGATGGPIHLLVDSSGLKLGGPGEWLVEKHGASKRRSAAHRL